MLRKSLVTKNVLDAKEIQPKGLKDKWSKAF